MAHDRLERGIIPYTGKGQPIFDECGAFRGYAMPAGDLGSELSLLEELVALRDRTERQALRSAP